MDSHPHDPTHVTFTTRWVFATDGTQDAGPQTTCGLCGVRFSTVDPAVLAGHAVAHSNDDADTIAWYQHVVDDARKACQP